MKSLPSALARTSRLLVPLSLVGSLALNVYFATELRDARQPPGPKTLAVGTQMRSLNLRAADGTTVKLALDGPETTVVYVMSPNCGWCTRNLPALRALASAAGQHFRFVGVSSTPLGKEHAEAMGSYPVSVVGAASTVERQRYGLLSTPQTIVVRNGIVTASWTGAYVSGTRTQIEKYFKVNLPDIVSAPIGQPKGS